MKNPGDLNHRDLNLLQRTKLDSLMKITHSRSSSYVLPPNKRPISKLPELYVILSQLIDLLQLSITPCNSCLHSPNITLSIQVRYIPDTNAKVLTVRQPDRLLGLHEPV